MNLVAHFSHAVQAAAEGDVIVKFRPEPKIKPKRRRPGFQNKTQDPHYQRDYKRDDSYRDRGYQKIPDKMKKWRAEQRRRLKDKLKTKG